MNRLCRRVSLGVGLALALSTPTLAQWSIGQPGTREAPKGQSRYAYLVMSDPLPGREFDFNDGYQNMHMGDLVQLQGWTGMVHQDNWGRSYDQRPGYCLRLRLLAGWGHCRRSG